MALVPSSIYEKTEVGGNARLHQGDNQNTFHFGSGNTIQIFTCDQNDDHGVGVVNFTTKRKRELYEVLDEIESRSNKRLRCLSSTGHQENHGCANDSTPSDPLVASPPVDYLKESQPREGTTTDEETVTYTLNRLVGAIGCGHDGLQLPTLVESEHHVSGGNSVEALEYHLEGRSPSHRGVFKGLLDRLRNNALFPAVTRILPVPQATITPEYLMGDTSHPSPSAPETLHNAAGPAQDLCATFLALLAFLAMEGSPSTSTPTSNPLAIQSQSRKLSLIAGLVAFALARYFCLPSLARSLSELGANYIVLEDPFRYEHQIPMAHCEHFKLLEAALSMRLSGSTAEVFVETRQFNLTLGARDGFAIRKSDWSTKGRIRPRQRVVMSVYLKKTNATCVQCQDDLAMSHTGQFSCHPCGLYYGNCASLKYSAGLVRRAAIRKASSRVATERRSVHRNVHNPSPPELGEVTEDDYNIQGLKNVDFKILRRRPSSGLFHDNSQKALSSAHFEKGGRTYSNVREQGLSSGSPRVQVHRRLQDGWVTVGTGLLKVLSPEEDLRFFVESENDPNEILLDEPYTNMIDPDEIPDILVVNPESCAQPMTLSWEKEGGRGILYFNSILLRSQHSWTSDGHHLMMLDDPSVKDIECLLQEARILTASNDSVAAHVILKMILQSPIIHDARCTDLKLRTLSEVAHVS